MDQMKEEILKETLSVYQSLMIHMVIGWDASVGMDQTRALMTLYRSYHTFLEFAKVFVLLSILFNLMKFLYVYFFAQLINFFLCNINNK